MHLGLTGAYHASQLNAFAIQAALMFVRHDCLKPSALIMEHGALCMGQLYSAAAGRRLLRMNANQREVMKHWKETALHCYMIALFPFSSSMRFHS